MIDGFGEYYFDAMHKTIYSNYSEVCVDSMFKSNSQSNAFQELSINCDVCLSHVWEENMSSGTKYMQLLK